MTTFNRGDIVAFGPEGIERVGRVTGSYEDPLRGEVLTVYVAMNAIKNQSHDVVPLKPMMNVRPATQEEWLAATERARQEVLELLDEYAAQFEEANASLSKVAVT